MIPYYKCQKCEEITFSATKVLETRYCPKCGTSMKYISNVVKVKEFYCPQCEKTVLSNLYSKWKKFCTYCGSKLPEQLPERETGKTLIYRGK